MTITVEDGEGEYFEPDENSKSSSFLQTVSGARNEKWCDFCAKEVINENCPDMVQHYRIFHRAEGYHLYGKDHRQESLTQYMECQVCLLDGKVNQNMTKELLCDHLRNKPDQS